MLNRTGNKTSKKHRLLKEMFEEDDEQTNEEDDAFDSLEELDTDNDEKSKNQASRRPNKERNHAEGHNKLLQDYFNEDSTYDDSDFQRRFRLPKELFLKVVSDLELSCPYFVQKPVSSLCPLLL